MRRLTLISLLIVLAAVIAAPSASAHQLQVIDPGPVELDLGTGEPARLIHLTLTARGDALEARLIPQAGSELEATLLVPDDDPERDAPAAELPRAEMLIGRQGAGVPFADRDGPVRWVDEVTGVAYRAVSQTLVDAAAGGEVSIRVARGSAATRAVLLIAPPDASFSAEGVEATPRTLLRLRAWQAAAPPSDRRARDSGDGAQVNATTWISASIALIGVLAAVWWVASGRRRSRERGVERDQRDT